MKQLFNIVILLVILCAGNTSFAQCRGGRCRAFVYDTNTPVQQIRTSSFSPCHSFTPCHAFSQPGVHNDSFANTDGFGISTDSFATSGSGRGRGEPIVMFGGCSGIVSPMTTEAPAPPIVRGSYFIPAIRR